MNKLPVDILKIILKYKLEMETAKTKSKSMKLIKVVPPYKRTIEYQVKKYKVDGEITSVVHRMEGFHGRPVAIWKDMRFTPFYLNVQKLATYVPIPKSEDEWYIFTMDSKGTWINKMRFKYYYKSFSRNYEKDNYMVDFISAHRCKHI